MRVALPSRPSEGVVLEMLAGNPLGPLRLATEVGAHTYLVDGPLANALTPHSWQQVGYANDFVVFKTRYQPVPFSFSRLPGGPAVHGSGRVVARTDNGATIQVHTDTPSLSSGA